MGVVTDPAILAQLNAGQPAAQPRPTSRPGPVYGAPPKPDKPDKPDTTWRPMTPAEVAGNNLDPTKVWKISSNGNFESAGSAGAPEKKYKPMPESTAGKYESGVGGVLDFVRLADTFDDNYAGNPVGGLENFGQKYVNSSIGTRGQSGWWSDMNSVDNIKRNELFGASLTAGEQAAWDRTTVTPGMKPELVRENLERRKQIAIGALKRRTEFLKANGYDPEAVDALLGEGALVLNGTAQPAPKAKEETETGKVVIPTMRGGLPAGTDPVFGMDKWGMPEAAFDREAYVQEKYGVTPDQEDWITSFWNSNAGNAGLTPESVKQAYTDAGITPPPDNSINEGINYARKGYAFSAFDTTQAEADYKAGLERVNQSANEKMNPELSDPNSAAGYVDRAKTGAALGFRDELEGVGGFIGNLVTGKNPVEGYKIQRDADRLQQEQQREAQGITGSAVEFAGSIPTALAIPTGPGGLLRNVGGSGVVGQAIRGGVRGGAITGFGQGEGVTNSVANAGAGGVIGGVLGAGIAKGAPLVAKGVGKVFSSKVPKDVNPDLIAAGERQGITMRGPDVAPSERGKMTVTQASQYGGQKIDDALADDIAQVEGRLSEIGGPGKAMADENGDYNLGQMGRKVGEDYIERSRVQKNDLYGEAEQLAEGQRVVPEKALAEVDRHIAELEAVGGNTNKAQIDNLKGLRADLAKGDGFSITEFQGLRSGASQKIKGDQALTATDADRRLGDVVRAFTDDAADQLPGAAASKLAEADQFFAKRQSFIDTTLKTLLGSRKNPTRAEAVGKQLVAMTRSRADADGLAKVLKEATPAQRADFAATIAERMGQDGSGGLSLFNLAKNIRSTPGNVRVMIFGKEGNAALNDLQAIARAKYLTSKGLNNSKSGLVMARQILSRITVAAGAAGAGGAGTQSVTGAVAVPLMTEIAAAIGQRRAAGLLLNPNFTKWIRQAPKEANPAEVKAYIGKLATALSGNSETAGVVNNVVPILQQRLLNSPAQSPLRAAASEQENN